MGCDMLVATGPAAVKHQSFFACNSHGPAGISPELVLCPGQTFAAGEVVRLPGIELPQARQTYTVLGSRPPNTWGYRHGLNEYHLAAGCTVWQSRLAQTQPGLLGTDLVRIALERCRSARQAFELLTTLVGKHGQGSRPDGLTVPGRGGYSTHPANDYIFLLADPAETYLVEAAGSCWVSLLCHGIRAVSDVALIRQDWHRISPGLAEQIISRGWWPDDGSKVDFCGALSADPAGANSALRRWGRATLLLEQHYGNVDEFVLRRVLSDHYDGTPVEVDPLSPAGPTPLCRHATERNPTATTASFIAALTAAGNQPPMAWCAFGSPCAAIYLPVFLDGDLPRELSRGDPFRADVDNLWRRTHLLAGTVITDAERWGHLRSSLTLLQARIDQEVEEFYADAARLKQQGERDALRRQCGLFMQNHVEQIDNEFQRIQAALRSRPVAVGG